MVRTPVAPPISSTSAARFANRPTVTTPGIRAKRVSISTRIRDAQTVHVEDLVAVVRHEALAQDRLAACFDHLPRDEWHGHRDHLDRQWEVPERGDELRLVDDADEAPGGAALGSSRVSARRRRP